MKQKSRIFIHLAFSIIIIIAVFACSDEDAPFNGDFDLTETEESGSVELLLGSGKKHLSVARFSQARLSFKDVLHIQPDNPQALFGLCLAQIQHWAGLLEIPLSGLNQLGSTKVTPELFQLEDGDVVYQMLAKPIIEDVIHQLRWQILDQIDMVEKIKKSKNFEFRLERFPIRFQGEERFALKQEWDEADAYLMSALTYFMHGLVTFFHTQNLENVEDAFQAFGGTETMSAGESIAKMFNNNPDLLGLDPIYGNDLWAESIKAMQQSIRDIQHANELMRAETDDQSDDVFVQNDSLTVKGVQNFAIHGEFKDDTNQMILLWHGKDLAIDTALQNLLDHANGTPKNRLSLEKDILVIIAVFVDFLRKSVGLDGILTALDLGLDKEILDLITTVGLDSGEEFPASLLTILRGLLSIPTDGIELDLATFITRPFAIRDFFPNTGKNPFNENQTILMSYECPRIGFNQAEYVSGGELKPRVYDRGPKANANPGAGNDKIKVNLTSKLATSGTGGTETIIDEESFSFSESNTIEAYFAKTIPTITTIDENTKKDDNTFTVPNGAEIIVTYIDENGDEDLELELKIKAGDIDQYRFHYDTECIMGKARDYSHFDQNEFTEAHLVPDPPASSDQKQKYPVFPADGYPMDKGLCAFPSPSMNGLLWINKSILTKGKIKQNSFVPADAIGINLLIASFIDAFSGGEEAPAE